MKIKPLHDRVLVKRVSAEQKTAGGLYIPDSAQEKPQQAIVVAVGPGKRNDQGELVALELKEGDRVLFAKYSGSEIKLDGDDHLFLREDDVIGVLTD